MVIMCMLIWKEGFLMSECEYDDKSLKKKAEKIINEKHELLRQFDKKEISKRKFNNSIQKYNDRINELIKKRLELNKNELHEREKQSVNNKRELTKKHNKIKKSNRERCGRKVDENSYTSLILKALMNPKLDTEKKVIKQVDEWKPGSEYEVLKSKLKTTISNIKHNRTKRFKDYEWNADEYLVNENAGE